MDKMREMEAKEAKKAKEAKSKTPDKPSQQSQAQPEPQTKSAGFNLRPNINHQTTNTPESAGKSSNKFNHSLQSLVGMRTIQKRHTKPIEEPGLSMMKKQVLSYNKRKIKLSGGSGRKLRGLI